VSEYLLKYFPYEDLVIYELGAGNGTLALNILDFLKQHYPEVYERTRYHIIEISSRLAERQRKILTPRHSMVTITNKDIFTWNQLVSGPCYFLAVEVVVSTLI
jgi:SAM-dependent MidA family methyltransferase